MANKKLNKNGGKMSDNIKVEGFRRKKRRMKLKAKGNNEGIIEKFSALSSKSAKFAKTTIKKKDTNVELKTTVEKKPEAADPNTTNTTTNNS